MSGCGVVRNERGIALVVALLVLVVVTLLSAVLIMTVNVDTQIAGHSQRSSQALNYAEAGIAEAISRIQNEDIPMDGANPRMVAQIFLASAGNIPPVGTDTLGMPTEQPAGTWLHYSAAQKGPDVLTVRYRTNEARTVVYRYDPNLNPAIQTVSGYPIFVITATGRQGPDERRVTTEVIQQPVNVSMKGALVSEKGVKFTGTAWACGYNHDANTPTDTGVFGRTGVGGCNENPGIQHWELPGGALAGIWSEGNVNANGASQCDGNPPKSESQSGFYAGPWETVGMSQADFFSWVGAPVNAVPASLVNGIYYLDNNNTAGDNSGGYFFHGEGSGMIYCDGDATFNAGFVYRGLIYVEGNAQINGHAWILGALVVKGQLTGQIMFNGGATILYSEDAVRQNISRARGQFVTLSWHEDN